VTLKTESVKVIKMSPFDRSYMISY